MYFSSFRIILSVVSSIPYASTYFHIETPSNNTLELPCQGFNVEEKQSVIFLALISLYLGAFQTYLPYRAVLSVEKPSNYSGQSQQI